MVQKYNRCKFPECMGNAVDTKDAGLCKRHAEMLRFFMWALENVRIKDKKISESGLILP